MSLNQNAKVINHVKASDFSLMILLVDGVTIIFYYSKVNFLVFSVARYDKIGGFLRNPTGDG